jgi:hypothetical protein
MPSALTRILALLRSIANRLERNPREAAAAIFALAFAVRVFVLFAAHTWPETDHLEVTAVATSIARGEGFSNPFAAYPTGPTAHVAPLYPYVVAGIFSMFGPNVGDLIKQLLACIISAAIYAYVPALAVMTGFSRSVGILAGFIGALSIVSIEVEVVGKWEGHLAALLFVVAITFWLRNIRSGELSAGRAALSGLVWGLLFLTSPSFLTVLCALCLVLAIQYRRKKKQIFVYIATVSAVAALVVAPWIVRNYRTFGALFWIRSNAGLEFYVSNAPGTKVTLAENVRGVFTKIHPNLSRKIGERFADIGEVAFNRDYMARFKQTVRSDPARFLKVTVARALWMWFPVTAHPIRDNVLIRDIYSCTISVMALVGLFLLRGKLEMGTLTLITAFFAYQVLYWFVQAATRYRFPIAWVYCLLCSYALLTLYEKWRAPQRHLTSTRSSMS